MKKYLLITLLLAGCDTDSLIEKYKGKPTCTYKQNVCDAMKADAEKAQKKNIKSLKTMDDFK